jgi:hypothetical protein
MAVSQNLGDDRLEGRAAIARYYFGSDSPEAVRRITALMREVSPANRIPFFMLGDRPASRKSWLDAYTRARAKNLNPVAEEGSEAVAPAATGTRLNRKSQSPVPVAADTG